MMAVIASSRHGCAAAGSPAVTHASPSSARAPTSRSTIFNARPTARHAAVCSRAAAGSCAPNNAPSACRYRSQPYSRVDSSPSRSRSARRIQPFERCETRGNPSTTRARSARRWPDRRVRDTGGTPLRAPRRRAGHRSATSTPRPDLRALRRFARGAPPLRTRVAPVPTPRVRERRGHHGCCPAAFLCSPCQTDLAGGICADNHFMTVYGEVSEPLLNLLTLHGVGYKWFSFLQGLEPSAVIPPQILVAAREATQPV